MIPTRDHKLGMILMHSHSEYDAILHDKGTYPDPATLIAAWPTASDGDYAVVLSTDTRWIWNGAAWADTGIPAVATKASQVDNDSSVEGDNVKEALEALDLVPNTVVYVDGSYTGTDSDGTINRPFASIQDAVAAVGFGTVLVAPGAYAEDVDAGGCLIKGTSPEASDVEIQGDVGGTGSGYFENITCSGDAFGMDGDMRLRNCVIQCPFVAMAELLAENSRFEDAMDLSGNSMLNNCVVEVTGGVIAIVHTGGGYLRILNSQVLGQISGADDYLLVSEEGTLVIDNSRIMNDDEDGKAVSCDNNAAEPDINKLLNSTFKGDVDAGAAETNISNIVLYSVVTGTELIYQTIPAANVTVVGGETLDPTTLPVFTATLRGAVPPPAIPAGLFLRDDGTWQVASPPELWDRTGAVLSPHNAGDSLVLTNLASMESPTLGPEQLTGGTWTSTGWTGDELTGWTHTAGNTTPLSYSAPVTAGSIYRIELILSGTNVGGQYVTYTIGGAPLGYAASGLGTYYHAPKAITTVGLTITPTTGYIGTLTVSVKEVTAGTAALMTLKSSDAAAKLETRVTSALYNVFIGLSAGSYNISGTNNTAVGTYALQRNTTGLQNTALGSYALPNNSSGANNVAIGYAALRDCSGGNNNIAVGNYVGMSCTTGEANTGVGTSALRNLTTGIGNTAVGYQTARNMTSGQYNVAVGYNTGYSNTSGEYNTAVGYRALYANSTGMRNVALGSYAGRYETWHDTFYVDNQDRGSSLLDKAGALLYGTFNAVPASQTLQVNAVLKAGVGQLQLINKPAPSIAFTGDGTDFLGYGAGITFDGSKNYYFTVKHAGGGDTTGLRIQANGVVFADSFVSGYLGTSAWTATSDTFGRVEGTKGYFKFGTNLEDVIKASAVVPGNGYLNYLSMFRIVSPEPTLKVAITQGAAGQTASLQEWQRSNGDALMTLSPAGDLTLAGGATGGLLTIRRDTATGRWLAIGNTDGGNVFTFDSPASYATQWGLSGNSFNFPGIVSVRGDGGTCGMNFLNSGPWVFNHGGVDQPIAFYTSPVVSGTLVERMRIYGDGGVQIGGTFGTSPGNGSLAVTTNSAAVVPMTVKGAAAQTANLQEWQTSAGVVRAQVGPTGGATFKADSNFWGSGDDFVYFRNSSGVYKALIGQDGSGNARLMMASASATTVINISANGGAQSYINTAAGLSIGAVSGAGTLSVTCNTAASIGSVVKGHATQSANLQEWRSSADAILASVGAAGDLTTASTAFHYWGDSATDGSWRFGRSGNNFVIERRESGNWITKSTIEA